MEQSADTQKDEVKESLPSMRIDDASGVDPQTRKIPTLEEEDDEDSQQNGDDMDQSDKDDDESEETQASPQNDNPEEPASCKEATKEIERNESASGDDGGGEDSSDGEDGASSDESDSNDANNHLSDYERLRLERIQRNQQYLSSLGLEDQKAKMQQPKRQRSRKSQVPTTATRKPSLREKTRTVRYTGPTISEVLGRKPRGPKPRSQRTDDDNQKKKEPAKQPNKPKSRTSSTSTQPRLERFLFREFQRLRTERSTALKQADRMIRLATREVAYWGRLVQQSQARRQSEHARVQQLQHERTLYDGSTLRELLHRLDSRIPEITAAVARFDQQVKYRQRQETMLQKRHAKNNKMKLLRAVDDFPKALKESYRLLDRILLERLPEEVHLERRATRSDKGTPAANTNKPISKTKRRRSKKASADNDEEFADDKSNWEAEPLENSNSTNPQRQRVAHSVGGWVSKQFASLLDRQWIDRRDMYVPQAGDTVLYYASAHKQFLDRYPDVLAKKTRSKLREPLWTRPASRGDASALDSNSWYSDEWLESVRAGTATAPIICKVTHTHTEFPPGDPYVLVRDADGSVRWREPRNTIVDTKYLEGTPLRLAVALRPLTSVLAHVRQRPPSFSVVMFPTKDFKAFVVPFWKSYATYHALAVGSKATVGDEGEIRINSFTEGSRRLDHLSLRGLTQKWKAAESLPAALQAELVNVSPKDRLPTKELVRVAKLAMRKAEESSQQDVSSNHVETGLLQALRLTLPPWECITASPTSNRRLMLRFNPSEIQIEEGWTRSPSLESSVRDIVEIALEDAMIDHPKASEFQEDVTDENAESYSSAVPTTMSTHRIMKRLKDDFYRSVDAVLDDVSAIVENCLLYNSPDAAISHAATSFVNHVKNNISDAMESVAEVKTETQLKHTHIAWSISEEDGDLYHELLQTKPYKGPGLREWYIRPKGWVPQAGDSILYSLCRHNKFCERHRSELSKDQMELAQVSTEGKGADDWLEATVLWTRPSFPPDRLKRIVDTADPMLIVGFFLEGAKQVDFVHWRPLIDEEPFVKPNDASTPDVSSFMQSSLMVVFSVLKLRCLNGTPLTYIDPKLEKVHVRKGYVPTPAADADQLEGLQALRRDDSDLLHLCGFLPNEVASRTPTNVCISPSPLCLQVIFDQVQHGTYRYRAAIENDVVESFINVIGSRLLTLPKKTKSRVSLKRIALALSDMAPVGDAEEEVVKDLRRVRDLYAVAMVAAVDVDSVVALLGLAAIAPTIKPAEDWERKTLARETLRSLIDALTRTSAMGIREVHNIPSVAVTIRYKGELIRDSREVMAFDCLEADVGGTRKKVTVRCDSQQFSYYHDPDSSLPETSQLQVSERRLTTVAIDSIELDPLTQQRCREVAAFLHEKPGRREPCARCRIRRRSFFECRVRRSHTNRDFDYHSMIKEPGGLDTLLSCLGQASPQKAIAPPTNDANKGNSDANAKMDAAQGVKSSSEDAAKDPNSCTDAVQELPSTVDAPKSNDAAQEPSSKAQTPDNAAQGTSGKVQTPKSTDAAQDPSDAPNSTGAANESGKVHTSKSTDGTQGPSDAPNSADDAQGSVKVRAPKSTDDAAQESSGKVQAPKSTGAAQDPSEALNSTEDKQGSSKAHAPKSIDAAQDPSDAPNSMDVAQESSGKVEAPKSTDAAQDPSDAPDGKDVALESSDKIQAPSLNYPELHEACLKLLARAQSFQEGARKASEGPFRLSSDFVKNNFPVDLGDNHYMYCIICGLTGDLFCCDTCPNVFHSACLGLKSVPEGHWSCDECQWKKSKSKDELELPFQRCNFDFEEINQVAAELAEIRANRMDGTKRNKENDGEDGAKDADQDIDPEEDEEDEVDWSAPPRETRNSKRERLGKESLSSRAIKNHVEVASPDPKKPKRRGRPRKSVEPPVEEDPPATKEKRRGRPRKSVEPEEPATTKVKRRGRPRKSLGGVEPRKKPSQGGRRLRSQLTKSGDEDEESDDAQSETSTHSKRNNRRLRSQDTESSDDEPSETPVRNKRNLRRLRRHGNESDDEPSEGPLTPTKRSGRRRRSQLSLSEDEDNEKSKKELSKDPPINGARSRRRLRSHVSQSEDDHDGDKSGDEPSPTHNKRSRRARKRLTPASPETRRTLGKRKPPPSPPTRERPSTPISKRRRTRQTVEDEPAVSFVEELVVEERPRRRPARYSES